MYGVVLMWRWRIYGSPCIRWNQPLLRIMRWHRFRLYIPWSYLASERSFSTYDGSAVRKVLIDMFPRRVLWRGRIMVKTRRNGMRCALEFCPWAVDMLTMGFLEGIGIALVDGAHEGVFSFSRWVLIDICSHRSFYRKYPSEDGMRFYLRRTRCPTVHCFTLLM